MAALFDQVPIFGVTIRQTGPFSSYRLQRESLPGTAGFRGYRLGQGPVSWTIRGRLIASSLAQMTSLLFQYGSYNNGKTFQFSDNGGVEFQNCFLTDYRPVGPYMSVVIGGFARVTVEVQGTVEWSSPEIGADGSL
jgi:hypothetical protein